VLGYVQYDKRHLVQCMRQANEEALRKGFLTFEESALLMRRFEEGMLGYTYLEEEPAPLFGSQLANAGNGLTMQPRDAAAPAGEPASTTPAAAPAPAAVPEPGPAARVAAESAVPAPAAEAPEPQAEPQTTRRRAR
jgi:hypothetical protein